MVKEMRAFGFDVMPDQPKMHSEAFVDNNGALAIANVPKQRPMTKHVNVKFCHFIACASDEENDFSFSPIDTEDQPADTLTEPLALTLLVKHRLWLLGW